MPVARIFASLVEEAEPICADLLARGYDVEIVFPDAVLPNPADLELRVERCSAEEAIARVEAVGSPSRCVFVTPAKGPHRELLLVEMTVTAHGMSQRHPLAMPGIPLAADQFAHLASESASAPKAVSDVKDVLPFPIASLGVTVSDLSSREQAATTILPARSVEARLARRREDRENLSKDMIAELNSFLAHAPLVGVSEGIPLRIFQSVRQSRSVERARKNWEGLTLLGVVASLTLLLSLGWYAAPSLPRHTAARIPDQGKLAAATSEPQGSSPLRRVSQGSLKPIVLETRSAASVAVPKALSRPRSHAVSQRGEPQIQDDLVAQDQVVRMAKGLRDKPSPHTATTSELVRPAAIRSAPIKRITDLK